MFRTTLSLLLALGVMFTHLAAVPHIDRPDGKSPPATRPRAHFHLGQLGITAPGVRPAAPHESSDHDADAWYLADASVTEAPDESRASDEENALATAHRMFCLVNRPAYRFIRETPAPPAPSRLARHFVLLN